MTRKKILKYISIVLLIKIVGFSLFFMYSVKSEKKQEEIKQLKINTMETISTPKQNILSKEQLQEERNNVNKWRLEEKMQGIHASSVELYDKKKNKKENLRILKAHLETFENTDIFLANYYEKTLYGSNDYKDVNARTIVLEEIQKVRRRGEGFIISTINTKGLQRYVLVKDLKFLDLYIGINIIE